jgi:hypothetical protein
MWNMAHATLIFSVRLADEKEMRGQRSWLNSGSAPGSVYGMSRLWFVVNTSVQLLVLPEFVITKNGWKVSPAVAIPW